MRGGEGSWVVLFYWGSEGCCSFNGLGGGGGGADEMGGIFWCLDFYEVHRVLCSGWVCDVVA